MHKSNRFVYANILQFQFDVVFLILTYGGAYLIARELTAMQAIKEYLWIVIIFIPLWTSIMALRGMYDNMTFYYFDRVLRNVLFASCSSGLVLGTLFFFTKENSTSRLFIGTFLLLSVMIMFLERCIFGLIYQRGRTNIHAPRIILVCSWETGHFFKRYLKKTHMRYHIVGVVQVGKRRVIQETINSESLRNLGSLKNSESLRNLGSLENLGDILKNEVIDEVVLALPKDYDGGVEQYVRLCEQMGITVHLILDLYDLKLSHVHISMLGPLPMLTFNTVNLNPVQKAAKRAIDIVGSLVGIAITLVVAIIIVPAILLDSPGPVIFKQTRVGRHGREFDLYKFRTMCVDAETKKEELQGMNEHESELMFKIKEDPRVTRVGKFLRKRSLDELPQFFNVLRGDMSLVGTRPPTLEEVALYDLEHLRRISIKPGLTGMWQVSGRSDITDFAEVVALDTQYIDNWSIWLDINILFKTVWQVFRMKSAY